MTGLIEWGRELVGAVDWSSWWRDIQEGMSSAGWSPEENRRRTGPSLVGALEKQSIEETISLLHKGADPNQKMRVTYLGSNGSFTREYAVFHRLIMARLPISVHCDAWVYTDLGIINAKDVDGGHQAAYRIQLLARHLICAGAVVDQEDVVKFSIFCKTLDVLQKQACPEDIPVSDQRVLSFVSTDPFSRIFMDEFDRGMPVPYAEADVARFSARLLEDLSEFSKQVAQRRRDLVNKMCDEWMEALFPRVVCHIVGEYAFVGGYLEKMAALDPIRSLSFVPPPVNAEDLA